jgi:hypothetical protein
MEELNTLAVRVRHGDATAAAAMRQQLEGQMVHIVRRTLRNGAGQSSLARRILAEARQAQPGGDWPREDRERLIGRIAHHMCESVVGGLRNAPAGRHAMRETVLA